MKSDGEAMFALHLRANKLAGWEPEYRFCDRRWRFDFAHPGHKIAVEIEGGIWANGRHSRGRGMQEDMEKYNRAVMLGWRVLRYSTDDVVVGKAIHQVREMIDEIQALSRLQNEALQTDKGIQTDISETANLHSSGNPVQEVA